MSLPVAHALRIRGRSRPRYGAAPARPVAGGYRVTASWISVTHSAGSPSPYVR